MHDEEPTALIIPETHYIHDEAISKLKYPALQFTQLLTDVAPLPENDVPAGHDVQPAAPLPLYVPEPHGVQADDYGVL